MLLYNSNINYEGKTRWEKHMENFQRNIFDMSNHLSELYARKKFLESKIHEKEEALLHVPDGTLKIHHKNNSTEYYQQKESDKKRISRYLKKEEQQLIQELAQKTYDKEILSLMKREYSVLSQFLDKYKPDSLKQFYDDMCEERKKLVTPIIRSEQQLIDEWKAFQYVGKEFSPGTPEYYTEKGERVRSKSEVIIANMLLKSDVLYYYECPLNLKGYGIVYPDFTCLNRRNGKCFYWEHNGMMDNPEYSVRSVKKIQQYEANGIFQGESLILTYESNQLTLNQKSVQRMINRYLL